MKTPNVTKDEFLEAVRQGVQDAMWQMITNATSMPCHDFYDTLGDAVERAILELGKDRAALDAITEGVSKAMPFEQLILNAIACGVREAMEKR